MLRYTVNTSEKTIKLKPLTQPYTSPFFHRYMSDSDSNSWIGGILELSSKVRYGITSRGVPIFRFIPYDKRLSPFAVGCSQRNLFYNVHAIVSATAVQDKPSASPTQQTNELPKGFIVQPLGIPTPQSELQVLLAAYAYDNKKSLRQQIQNPSALVSSPDLSIRERLDGFTFNIDPAGCRDVDDTFTVKQVDTITWKISINIADVSAWIEENSPLDSIARLRATSFYSPVGECLAPMLPPEISEGLASLLPGQDKPTYSLTFTFSTYTYAGKEEYFLDNFEWLETTTNVDKSFTYEEAQAQRGSIPELQVVEKCSQAIQSLLKLSPVSASASASASAPSEQTDSHIWVQNMMILYNWKAGLKLHYMHAGILRSHKASNDPDAMETLAKIHPDLAFLAYESAKFCSATDEDTAHYGLGIGKYAYASSPIRRYCDLVNQRVLKGSRTAIGPQLIELLNRRQKQAKAFSRDLFFMSELSNSSDCVTGVVVSSSISDKPKFKVYVPAWKRTVTVKTLVATEIARGTKVSLEWFEDTGKPHWKERIIFRAKVQ